MEAKRLGLLRELVPTAVMMAVLLNPTNAAFQLQMKDVDDAARALRDYRTAKAITRSPTGCT